jgi:hypothetical protein
MKAKLIKERFDFYGLKVDDKIIATNDVEVNKMFNYPHTISLKNCEAIENGYDLDELINQFYMSDNKHKASIYSFKKGFQKALEILGDKKYTEEDLKWMFQYGFGLENGISRNEYDAQVQSLQQTEWDVEIVTDKVTAYTEDGLDYKEKIPKLDADGCLILKRAI